MANTGMIRKVDDLGRVVIPKEIRDNLDLNRGDPLEITVHNGKITFSKIESSCIFCGSEVDNIAFKEKNICQRCLDQLQ